MTKYHLSRQYAYLPFFLLFIISCNGQGIISSSPLVPKDSVETSKTISARQQKGKTTPYGPGDIVQCALQDKTGKLWFGTADTGVFCDDARLVDSLGQSAFINYTEKDGLCDNNVGVIVEDKNGNLWFGTNDGASRFDGKTFTNFPVPNDARTQTPNQWPHKNIVTAILQDKAGNFWFGTLDDGVYRYNGKVFTNFLSGEVVKCMFEDKNGNIWVGSWSNGGVYRSDKGNAKQDCIKNTCKHDLHSPKDLIEHQQERARPVTDFTRQAGLSDDMIACIAEDKMGNVWFGTRNHGVCRYDGTSVTNFSNQDGLCNNNISAIVVDQAGNLWFGSSIISGSKAGGLCRYDGKNFTNFSPKEGLENNDISWIMAAENGNLWFGGRYGRLFRYDGTIFTDFSEQLHP